MCHHIIAQHAQKEKYIFIHQEKTYPMTGDKTIITQEKQSDDTEINVALCEDGKRSFNTASVRTSNRSLQRPEKNPPMHIAST